MFSWLVFFLRRHVLSFTHWEIKLLGFRSDFCLEVRIVTLRLGALGTNGAGLGTVMWRSTKEEKTE